jgi:hypothetical protein
MSEKMKILFLAANPRDVKYRLELGREIEQITAKIRNGSHGELFEFHTEWCVRPDVLQETLLRHRPHILHFSGHGTRGRGIAFENRDGNTVLVTKEIFAEVLNLLKDNIRVVVLNACHTRDHTALLLETIDYTVGMNRPVGDRAARVFAAYFYQGLAYGLTVQEAFRSGINELGLEGISGSDIPELLIRRGVDPSRRFLDEIDLDAKTSTPLKLAEDKASLPAPSVGIANHGSVTVGGDQIGHISGGVVNLNRTSRR